MKNGRNEKGLQLLAVGLAALTYAGAVVYGDIMFLQVISKAFPQSGLMQALAYAGAITTAVSALCLPIAMHWWFHPGLQFIWGVIFWLLDIAALGLNSMLAYQLAMGGLDSSLSVWAVLSPATPLLAVIGWGLAFLFDPSHQERQARAEMRADQIETYAEEMKKAAQSPEVKQIILEAAVNDARDFAHSLNYHRPVTAGQGAELRISASGETQKIEVKPENNGHAKVFDPKT